MNRIRRHKPNCTHYQWEITKLRFGKDGELEHWEFESEKRCKCEYESRGSRTTRRYLGLTGLAMELSLKPESSSFEFFPKKCSEKYVSLSNGSLTQEGIIDDNELGQLATMIQKYIPKREFVKKELGIE